MHLIDGLLTWGNRFNDPLGKLLLDHMVIPLHNLWVMFQALFRAILSSFHTEKVVVSQGFVELLPREGHSVAAILEGDVDGKFIVECLLFLQISRDSSSHYDLSCSASCIDLEG